MKPYKALWLETAQKDLKKILDYISFNIGIKKSKEILKRLKTKANTLNISPQKGRIVPELAFFNINTYRELIEIPWRVIYKIDDNRVFVSAVIDSRRNVEDILLQRFF